MAQAAAHRYGISSLARRLSISTSRPQRRLQKISPYLDPSTGLIRDLVLVLDAAVVFYCVLYVFYLILGWAQGPVRRVTDIRLAWAVFMGGTAVRTFCFMQGDIYASLPTDYAFWVRVATLAMMAALVGFFGAVERVIPYKTRHAMTLSGAALVVIAVFTSPTMTKLLSFGSGVLAGIVIVLFFQHLRGYITDKTRLSYRLVSVGILAGFVGFLLHLDEVYYYLGPFVYVTGILILLLGTLLFGSSVIQSPAYDELDWIDQLAAIYVMGSGGALLFTHQFQRTGTMNVDLAAAGLTGVEELMREITGTSDSVNTISIGEYEVIFVHGRLIVTALICRASYRVLLEKCREFTEQYELMFGEEITRNIVSESWNRLAEKLVNSVFMGSQWESDTTVSELKP